MTRGYFLCLPPKVTWLTFPAHHLFSSVSYLNHPCNEWPKGTRDHRGAHGAPSGRTLTITAWTPGGSPHRPRPHVQRRDAPVALRWLRLALTFPVGSRDLVTLAAPHPENACSLRSIFPWVSVNQLIETIPAFILPPARNQPWLPHACHHAWG